MPTFIKTGFWEKLSKAPKEYLNLDNLIQSIGGGGGTSYQKYVALMSQGNSQNPTVIVLENTIGNIVWTRVSEGMYNGTLANAFPTNKTVCFATTGSNYGNSNTVIGFSKESESSNDIVRLITGWVYNGGGYPQDINSTDGAGPHYEVSIEIRVYP